MAHSIHINYPIPTQNDVRNSVVVIEPQYVSVDDVLVHPTGFINSNILMNVKTPSKLNDKKLEKFSINDFATLIQSNSGDVVVLLDKVQRKFVNTPETMQTFFNAVASTELDILRGSVHTHSDFENKHEVAYFFKFGFGNSTDDQRKIYIPKQDTHLTNKKIMLIFDGQQRSTMLIILFYRGFYGINPAEKGSNAKRRPYLDLASIYEYTDSRGILKFKMHEKFLSDKHNPGLHFYSESEAKQHKEDKFEKGYYSNLICTQEFGTLNSYVIDGRLDSQLFIQKMIVKYDMHLNEAAFVKLDRLTHYMYDVLFVNKGIHIIIDEFATAESNSEGYMSMNALGTKASKEVVIESAINAETNTKFGLEISDPIGNLYCANNIKSSDIAARAMRSVISAMHNSRMFFYDEKVTGKKPKKKDAPILVTLGVGDGTTFNTQNAIINSDSNRTLYAKEYMKHKDNFSKATNATYQFLFADGKTKYRPELNFIDSLDDNNKCALIHMVWATYFYLSVGKIKFDPFSDKKQSYAILRSMFGVKSILECLSGEISFKYKTLSNFARAIAINSLKFTPGNIAKILEHHNIDWKLIIQKVNPRDFTSVGKNTDDTKYLKIVNNIADSIAQIESNKQADHIHNDQLMTTPALIGAKIDTVFANQTSHVIFDLKRFCHKFGDTLLNKMLLVDKINKAKSGQDPSVFFDDNVSHRNAIRVDYGMGLYSENETIDILKLRNFISLFIHTQKQRMHEYAKLNYLIMGSDDSLYPMEAITTKDAFEAMIEGTKMKTDFPALYNVIMNETTNALYKDNIMNNVK